MSDFIDGEMRIAVTEYSIGRLAMFLRGLAAALNISEKWDEVLAITPPTPDGLTPEEVYFHEEVNRRSQILLATGVPHLRTGKLQ